MRLPLDPIARTARAIPGGIVNFVLPPRCLSCGDIAGSLGGLCSDCWSDVTFIAAPQCAQCGYPFEMDFGYGVKCGHCLSAAPSFDRARSATAYGDRIAEMVISFKHSDRTDMAPGLAAWMRRAGADLLADADIITPVPMHRRRLFQRRFNQAALLARRLARETQATLISDLMIRHRDTASQGRMSAAKRRRNVEGAFRTNPLWKPNLAGARVLIIDDVLTTGATVNAMARRLKRDGAGAVDVLTLTRVVRETAAV